MTPREIDQEAAREGGGAASQRRPDRRHHRTDIETAPMLPAEPPVENRREIPGGSFHPAHTPGATGPTTRDTDQPVSTDAGTPVDRRD
jgi:hypothetical protein